MHFLEGRYLPLKVIFYLWEHVLFLKPIVSNTFNTQKKGAVTEVAL